MPEKVALVHAEHGHAIADEVEKRNIRKQYYLEDGSFLGAGETGEHYITTSRAGWHAMVSSAAGAMIGRLSKNGGRVAGLLWYQGESDTGTSEVAQSYGDRFVAAVQAWRAGLQLPSLPVLTVQLNRFYAATDPNAKSRSARVRGSVRRSARWVASALERQRS